MSAGSDAVDAFLLQHPGVSYVGHSDTQYPLTSGSANSAAESKETTDESKGAERSLSVLQEPEPAVAKSPVSAKSPSSKTLLAKAALAERLESTKAKSTQALANTAVAVPAIDLSAPTAMESMADDERDMVLGRLLDNFVQWKPRIDEYDKVREYGLKARELSVTLKEQCQRFAEYRQEVWNWNRDAKQAAPKTVSNNIQVLLLLGGFACHVTRHHRIKPEEFDLGIFSNKHIEHHMVDFLRYLHSTRELLFSTIANYMNSLVVLAKFWFSDEPLADLSFRADTVDAEFALTGLRRLRDQTNAKAKAEAIQRPVHSQWLSWQDCQLTRNRCIGDYESSRVSVLPISSMSLKDKRYVQLKRLVCLAIYTIAPPPRCSIVRLLEWRTTLVKKRQDPGRYVIDLLHHAEAPAAKHKTSKHYRRAILPLPRLLTPYLDELRKHRLHDGDTNWVFVNTRGKSYEPAAWTEFVKSCFKGHSRANRAPNGSLLRSIFVSWLNSVPHDKDGQAFLDEIKQSAATYQTHSLRIANQLYDKDIAAEARLRELVDFCEAYAVRSKTAKLSGGTDTDDTDENLDSDDDDFEATAPLEPRQKTRLRLPLPLRLSRKEAKTDMEVDEQSDNEEDRTVQVHSATRAAEEADDATGESSVDGSSIGENIIGETSIGENSNEEEAEMDRLFLPERIVGKKTKRWHDYYLIRWSGYTDADNTWEPADFFDDNCSDLVTAYENSRMPDRIVSKRIRLRPGERQTLEYYEVHWCGQKETTMEPALAVEASSSRLQPLLQAWIVRQQEREKKSKAKKAKADRGSYNPGAGTLLSKGRKRGNGDLEASVGEQGNSKEQGKISEKEKTCAEHKEWSRSTRSRPSLSIEKAEKKSQSSIIQSDLKSGLHDRQLQEQLRLGRLVRGSNAFAMLFLRPRSSLIQGTTLSGAATVC